MVTFIADLKPKPLVLIHTLLNSFKLSNTAFKSELQFKQNETYSKLGIVT